MNGISYDAAMQYLLQGKKVTHCTWGIGSTDFYLQYKDDKLYLHIVTDVDNAIIWDFNQYKSLTTGWELYIEHYNCIAKRFF